MKETKEIENKKKSKKVIIALIIIFVLVTILIILGIIINKKINFNKAEDTKRDILESVNINPELEVFKKITKSDMKKILEITQLTEEEFEQFKLEYTMSDIKKSDASNTTSDFDNVISEANNFFSNSFWVSEQAKIQIVNLAEKNFESLQNYILLSDEIVTNYIYNVITSNHLYNDTHYFNNSTTKGENTKIYLLNSAVASGIIHSYFNYDDYKLKIISGGNYANGSEIMFVVNNENLVLMSYDIGSCWVSIYKGTKYNDNKKALYEVRLNSVSELTYWKNIETMPATDKPIIYLYPEQETEVTVKLGKEENLTCTYPKYEEEGWKVLAKPNGDLVDLKTGRNLYSLYWEGINTKKYNKNLEEGFVVKGEDTIKFLEEKLEILGLSQKEAQEFIIYWLPQMENNKYNYIRFQTKEEINENMPLEIIPKPDTIIRVVMEWKELDKHIEVKEQKLETPQRKGFVAVEWGGTKIVNN